MEKSSGKKPNSVGEPSGCAIISDEIDRISKMPDDILHYLLSFVETIYVVRLSVLSRRWKTLWRTIPYLNFDITGHYGGWRDKKFQELIDGVLMNQHSTKITRFSLHCSHTFCEEHIMRWISVALSRNVQQLELKLIRNLFDHGADTFKVPNSVITCESLLVLKLSLPHCVLQLPSNLNFKQLTSLYLELVEITDEDFTRRLLSECSLLQHLTLIFRFSFNVKTHVVPKTLDIASSSLKSLTLTSQQKARSFDLRISCPNLHSFTYMGELLSSYNFHNVSSLDYLRLGILDECLGHILYQSFDILKQVQNIRVLELGGHFMRYPTDLQKQAQMFYTTLHRLKFFKLSECPIDGWYTQGMFLMLENFPNLEALTLVIEKDYECSELDDDWDSTEVNAYWKNRLKSVSLINFKGIQRELEFVKFMLENCLALENFTIYWSEDKKRTLTKNKKMMKFRRASSVAKVKCVP